MASGIIISFIPLHFEFAHIWDCGVSPFSLISKLIDLVRNSVCYINCICLHCVELIICAGAYWEWKRSESLVLLVGAIGAACWLEKKRDWWIWCCLWFVVVCLLWSPVWPFHLCGFSLLLLALAGVHKLAIFAGENSKLNCIIRFATIKIASVLLKVHILW